MKNWNVLAEFFSRQLRNDPDACQIHTMINDKPHIKVYLMFLEPNLKHLEKFIKFFQSNEILIDTFFIRIRTIYLTLAGYFLRPSYIERNQNQFHSNNPALEHEHRPIPEIFLRPSLALALRNLPQDIQTQLRTHFKEFYQTCCTEIKDRLLGQNFVLDKLAFLGPSIVFDRSYQNGLQFIVEHFNYLLEHPDDANDIIE